MLVRALAFGSRSYSQSLFLRFADAQRINWQSCCQVFGHSFLDLLSTGYQTVIITLRLLRLNPITLRLNCRYTMSWYDVCRGDLCVTGLSVKTVDGLHLLQQTSVSFVANGLGIQYTVLSSTIPVSPSRVGSERRSREAHEARAGTHYPP